MEFKRRVKQDISVEDKLEILLELLFREEEKKYIEVDIMLIRGCWEKIILSRS